jgi:aspartoacylase
MKIANIAIVGGTHGNEYTGIYLLKIFKERNTFSQFKSFATTLLLSNPKAFENQSRFIDFDLNRSFLNKDLKNITLSAYEQNRSKAINNALGPKGKAKTDFIIDLHTTTANMGVTIILVDDNPFNLQIAAHLKRQLQDISIFYISPSASDNPYLNSIAKYGFALEVGPIPNGVLRHDILTKTYQTVICCLEFIEAFNQGLQAGHGNKEETVEVFEYVKQIDFRVVKINQIAAMLHRDLQDKDFSALHKGTKIFERFNGDSILYDDDESLYPVFINEAAYYYKKTAFTLTRKKQLPIQY